MDRLSILIRLHRSTRWLGKVAALAVGCLLAACRPAAAQEGRRPTG